MLNTDDNGRERSAALDLLISQRPRNVNWFQAAGLLFGDWGTSRLYVLGLAFLVAGRSSIWLIGAMSLLILAVGWAYTQICRLYPDGGGVYTAGKRQARIIGVIGALLLFADYTITASLSSVEAFHYFGLGARHQSEPTPLIVNTPAASQAPAPAEGVGEYIQVPALPTAGEREPLWTWPPSPGLWAIFAIGAIGALNLLGPKHTSGYAIFAAAGMMAITVLIVVFALPQINWSQVHWGRLWHGPWELWHGFVYIVLALSGVEAIANLTGVMKKPVYATARKSIWIVAAEVAVLNLLLALAMVALAGTMTRDEHTEDMLAYMARIYIGRWGEWPVRIIAGLLLLSATNTAVNGLMSIVYVMSRDKEMPAIFQKLNGFGSPWIAALVAAAVPAFVLLFAHDLATLASLYAIGVVGAVALNAIIASFHPRLRKRWRRVCMICLGVLLVAIWITLALTKLPALIFVTIVLAAGLILRQVTRIAARRRPRVSLLRQAIMDQLPPDAMLRPKLLVATAGSDALAEPALQQAAAENAALVVCFVRDVALSYRVEAEVRLSIDTDPAAQELFASFLEHGHRYGVPIIPFYDTGTNSPELIAEAAAINGVQRVLIGSSRRGTVYQLIKGSFQRKLESLLPPEIPVQVLGTTEPPAGAAA